MIPKASLLFATLFCGLSTVASAETPIQNVPPSNLAWEETPEGVAFASLVGNRFEEAYMAMVRLPAGLVSPAHKKSAEMFGIIVSGVMTHTRLGEDTGSTVHLTKGSFYRIPANVPHVSSCVSEIDCVAFLYQDGMFDFLPVSK